MYIGLGKAVPVSDSTHQLLKVIRDQAANETGKKVTFEMVIKCLIEDAQKA